MCVNNSTCKIFTSSIKQFEYLIDFDYIDYIDISNLIDSCSEAADECREAQPEPAFEATWQHQGARQGPAYGYHVSSTIYPLYDDME